MQSLRYEADVVIVGGGLAGLVTALELLEKNRRVVVLDRDEPERLGGLARESFGGVFLVDTPHQRRLRIQDSPGLAWSDWQRCARFGPEDHWPRRWAQLYCERSIPLIFEFLDRLGVRFLPLVNCRSVAFTNRSTRCRAGTSPGVRATRLPRVSSRRWRRIRIDTGLRCTSVTP